MTERIVSAPRCGAGMALGLCALLGCGDPAPSAPPASSTGGSAGSETATTVAGLLPTSSAADAAAAAAALCSSGVRRGPDESEGPEMLPGHACTSCHAQSNAASGEGDAPIFKFAGTLFPSEHEPDDCEASAAEGAQVVVTDALGRELTAIANHSGNFFLEQGDLLLPITARVSFEGRERSMLVPQNGGDCNGCHSVAGRNGAPGRILLP